MFLRVLLKQHALSPLSLPLFLAKIQIICSDLALYLGRFLNSMRQADPLFTLSGWTLWNKEDGLSSVLMSKRTPHESYSFNFQDFSGSLFGGSALYNALSVLMPLTNHSFFSLWHQSWKSSWVLTSSSESKARPLMSSALIRLQCSAGPTHCSLDRAEQLSQWFSSPLYYYSSDWRDSVSSWGLASFMTTCSPFRQRYFHGILAGPAAHVY